MTEANHTMKGQKEPNYRLPAAENRAEIQVMRSRFIACASPALSVEDARKYVQTIRREFVDASHHVAAYRIGFGKSVIEHCNDDGEPSGTAGKPVLAVLKGSNIGDIVVVVVRYFGGIKLGTGGLTRAYRDAAKAVIALLPLALRQMACEMVVTLPYAFYQKACGMIERYRGEIYEEIFEEKVMLAIRLPSEIVHSLEASLTDLTQGMCEWKITRRDVSVIVPFPPLP